MSPLSLDMVSQLLALGTAEPAGATPKQSFASPLEQAIHALLEQLDLAPEGDFVPSDVPDGQAPVPDAQTPVSVAPVPVSLEPAVMEPLELAHRAAMEAEAPEPDDDVRAPEAERLDILVPESLECLAVVDQTIAPVPTAPASPSQPVPLERAPAVEAAPPSMPTASERAEQIETIAAARAQSHVHLVVDDAGEQVVMTVAVRGNDVHVAMRATADDTASNLARNVAGLDQSMRVAGLTLAGLDVQGEAPRGQGEPTRKRDERKRDERTRHDPDDLPFFLEALQR